MFPHSTTKEGRERERERERDVMPLKQIIGQTIMHNKATSSFKVEL